MIDRYCDECYVLLLHCINDEKFRNGFAGHCPICDGKDLRHGY